MMNSTGGEKRRESTYQRRVYTYDKSEKKINLFIMDYFKDSNHSYKYKNKNTNKMKKMKYK